MIEYLLARVGERTVSAETASVSKGLSSMTNEDCKALLGFISAQQPLGLLAVEVSSNFGGAELFDYHLARLIAQRHEPSDWQYQVALPVIELVKMQLTAKPIAEMLPRLNKMELSAAKNAPRKRRKVTSVICPYCHGRVGAVDKCRIVSCEHGRIAPRNSELKQLLSRYRIDHKTMDMDAFKRVVRHYEAEVNKLITHAESIAMQQYYEKED